MNSNLPVSTVAVLGRRLMAMLYDSLLLVALWFLSAIPLLYLPPEARQLPGMRLAIQFYFALVAFGFFGGFWVHGGQTLGMRAWRLQLVTERGRGIGWARALVRFLAAILSWLCLGLGFLWILADRQGLAWHDRLSKTRLVLLPRRGNK
jgi:uncharacterized RDD family membrane protein YckC